MVASPMDEAAVIDEPTEAEPPPQPPRRIAYRHRLPTRLWHWVNALTVFVLLMSGLMIFNAHPHLYWGQFAGPRLGDDPVDLQPRRRPALAPRLRLAAFRAAAPLPDNQPHQPPRAAGSRAHPQRASPEPHLA